jgi:hypothetical protein
LTCIAPIRPLQLCADGVYQPSFRSLGGTPNYGPRQIENEKLIAKAKDLDVCNASISDLRSEK